MQKLPAGHVTHSDCPAAGWYSPGAHAVQVAALSDDTVPGSHAVGIAEPIPHAEPAGHAAQSPRDAPPSAPRHEPASHSVTALAPAPHQPPAPHGSHAVAFDDDWKVPRSHAEQLVLPSVAEKEPGEQ